MKTTSFPASAVAIMAVVAILTGSTPAGAQRVASIATLGVSMESVELRFQDSAKVAGKRDRAGNALFRFVTSAMVSGAGMVAGAYVGAGMEGPCACDDPGLQGALLGGLGGMIAGASIGAAAPQTGGACSFGERLARSLAGSLAGSVAGILSVYVVHNGAILVVMPAVTAGGAIGMLGDCR